MAKLEACDSPEKEAASKPLKAKANNGAAK